MTTAEKGADLAARGEPWPTCACHGEPLSWHKNVRSQGGGGWTCRVNTREALRRWKAANPEKEREALRRWRAANPEKRREASRRWRAANPEKRREASRRWRAANPEKEREAWRRWRAANPEKRREASRRWRAANPETTRARNQRRRARKRGVECEAFTNLEVFERDAWTCGLCGKPVNRRRRYPDQLSASLDHVVPLSLGGSHTRANVQLTHLRCNLSKGARVAA